MLSRVAEGLSTILGLIDITSKMSRGAKFAKIVGYSSDKSDHSEIADHLVVLNFSYANMRKDDKETLSKFNINSIDINKFNYDSIDLKGVDINDFKNEVRNNLSLALYEINNPKPKKKENDDEVSNDEYLNDIVVFNWNTKRLSILGQEVKKETIVKGEYKKSASGAKTIAKKLIMKHADLRVDKYRRFAIDNLNIVNLMGETLEIQ